MEEDFESSQLLTTAGRFQTLFRENLESLNFEKNCISPPAQYVGVQIRAVGVIFSKFKLFNFSWNKI